MAPIQRRRGIPAIVWKVITETDARGNVHKRAVPDDAEQVTVWMIPQRSARGEVPGQLAINVIRIGIPGHFTELDLWTRIDMLGKEWDVVTPPSYHHGTRHTRHWTMDIRERPSKTGDM